MADLTQLAPGDIIQHGYTGRAHLVIGISDGQRQEVLTGSGLVFDAGRQDSHLVITDYDIASAVDCRIFTDLPLALLDQFNKLPIPRMKKYERL